MALPYITIYDLTTLTCSPLKKFQKLDDVKFSILKNGIGIEGQKVLKQARDHDQRSMEPNKDGPQLSVAQCKKDVIHHCRTDV